MSGGLVKPLKWFYHEFGIVAIHETGRNAYLMILARTCRMFAYGTNSLILAIFFSALNYSDHQIGVFMTLTLLGDVFLGTFLTLIADHVGRRKVLLGGSMLMTLSGIIFATFENFWILLAAAIVGVISVTGGDFGPFRSVEESVLSQLTTPATRADVLAWYVTISSLGSSIGSEACGRMIHALERRPGWTQVDAYHALFWIYTAMGIVNAVLVLTLTDACEMRTSGEAYAQVPQYEDDQAGADEADESDEREATTPSTKSGWKARFTPSFASRMSQISAPTRSIMWKFWFLISFDSLADGMVPYSLTNYFLDDQFHPAKSTLGDVQSIGYFLSAIGAVFAGPLARKIGLINTMVFTHVPSSTAVLVFPLSPAFWVSAALLFVRAGLNNMDQAPRSAFIAGVVRPEERTAVMGITSMLRTLAATFGPTVTGVLAAGDEFWIAFVAAGVCRLVYDFGLYALFLNTVLYQHELKPEDLPNGMHERREHDIEENLEMHSIGESDDSLSSNEEAHKKFERDGMNSGLQLPMMERVRSRSPHRSIDMHT